MINGNSTSFIIGTPSLESNIESMYGKKKLSARIIPGVSEHISDIRSLRESMGVV